jgi:hypothetical protein
MTQFTKITGEEFCARLNTEYKLKDKNQRDERKWNNMAGLKKKGGEKSASSEIGVQKRSCQHMMSSLFASSPDTPLPTTHVLGTAYERFSTASHI